ncbi:MAG: exo-alpha-sialidase [Bacteroidia bacterium]|nr:exo-alpha-sialidase [Bacteroidia bacterium]
MERGFQPSLSVDTTGIVRMTYGVGDSIFYAESNDSGRTFLKEVLVDTLRNLHLGMARGPQISSSANYTLIVAMNKPGDMYAYSLEHSKNTWSKKNKINDVPRVAKEGLASVGSDQVDIFYATWLDLRDDNKNKVYLSKSLRGGVQWEENVLVYRSPDSTVCECCQPTIAVSGENVFVMFRNWLNGSRDMYVAKSGNQSIQFSEPVKIGEGTWKLNGCPMDGGGLTVYNTGEVMSTWRREGDVFISSMNQGERKLGSGKQSDIASSGSNYGVTWSDEEQIYFASSAQPKPFVIGKGSFPTIEALKNKNYLIAWEGEGSIKVHVVPGLK